jgi:hypothetical protein
MTFTKHYDTQKIVIIDSGAGEAPARKCPFLVNIYNFNKNN